MKLTKKMRGIQAIERSVLIDSNASRFVDRVGGLVRGTWGWDRHLLRQSKGGYMRGIARVDQQQMKHNFDAIMNVIMKTKKRKENTKKLVKKSRKKKQSMRGKKGR